MVGDLIEVVLHSHKVAEPMPCVRRMVGNPAAHDYQTAEQTQLETAFFRLHDQLVLLGRGETECDALGQILLRIVRFASAVLQGRWFGFHIQELRDL